MDIRDDSAFYYRMMFNMNERQYKKIIECLIELIDEGVYIVDNEGYGIFYNSNMAETEEINVTDVIGREFHTAFPGIKIDESTMYQALHKGISTKNKEQTYTNLYGKEVTTINSTVPVKDKDNIIAAVEVVRNITNIRSLSDTIQELRGDKIPVGKAKKPSIKHYNFDNLVGETPQFLEVVAKAKRAAGNAASVFIYGETGTGKELFAQSIHFASNRKDKPFLAQNCAALPESLLEGILFGTAKGGFTGAVDRAGLFEQANGGTLLLDEISAMPYNLQSKLLRVLQEDYIRRVGGTKDIPIDVRIIATVNELPMKLIEEGKLRRDLYYRLNVVNLSIPPLRERKDDIPILVDAFLDKYNEKYYKNVEMLEPKALDKLKNYNYPGNVRELENIIIQSVALVDEETKLSTNMVQTPIQIDEIGHNAARWNKSVPLNDYLAEEEKMIIRGAMMEAEGNISKAADILQIKRQTLQHKLKKYKMI